jgi:16S rRNA (uracil1498-N3)-methyltransferase
LPTVATKLPIRKNNPFSGKQKTFSNNPTSCTGRGLEIKARIQSTDEKRVHFAKLTSAQVPRGKDFISLAQAMTKNKSMDLIIQKATELGVSELIPLQSDRSVTQVNEEKAESRLAKWQQLTVEAAKQCGQNWLPQIRPVQKPKAFVSQGGYTLKLIASLQPEALPLKKTLAQHLGSSASPRRIVVMIGPEGDFTPAEIGEARAAGFLPVSLGPIILRSETAAFFLLSALAYELSEG